jgi:hypothetical protein
VHAIRQWLVSAIGRRQGTAWGWYDETSNSSGLFATIALLHPEPLSLLITYLATTG